MNLAAIVGPGSSATTIATHNLLQVFVWRMIVFIIRPSSGLSSAADWLLGNEQGFVRQERIQVFHATCAVGRVASACLHRHSQLLRLGEHRHHLYVG